MSDATSDEKCGKCGARGFYRRPVGVHPRWLCYEHWEALPDDQKTPDLGLWT